MGTSFAFAAESGVSDATKQEVLQKIASNDLTVYTDPVASPTGFPFKVICRCLVSCIILFMRNVLD